MTHKKVDLRPKPQIPTNRRWYPVNQPKLEKMGSRFSRIGRWNLFFSIMLFRSSVGSTVRSAKNHGFWPYPTGRVSVEKRPDYLKPVGRFSFNLLVTVAIDWKRFNKEYTVRDTTITRKWWVLTRYFVHENKRGKVSTLRTPSLSIGVGGTSVSPEPSMSGPTQVSEVPSGSWVRHPRLSFLFEDRSSSGTRLKSLGLLFRPRVYGHWRSILWQ